MLIILVLLLIEAVPSWPHSSSWGYGPSGVIGLRVLIVVALLVLGRIRAGSVAPLLGPGWRR